MASTYSASGFVRGVIVATTIAGTLDILSAFAFNAAAGGTPLGVLRGIGSAVLPQWQTGDLALAAIGLAAHFAIMAAMATVYFAAAAQVRLVNRVALLSGIGYGLVLWGVMYWIVLPHRFPTLFPVSPLLQPREVGMELFSHVVLVGLPIALVARAAALWHDTDY